MNNWQLENHGADDGFNRLRETLERGMKKMAMYTSAAPNAQSLKARVEVVNPVPCELTGMVRVRFESGNQYMVDQKHLD